MTDEDRRLLGILVYLLVGAGYAAFFGMREPWFERCLAGYRKRPGIGAFGWLSGALAALVVLWPFAAAARLAKGGGNRRG